MTAAGRTRTGMIADVSRAGVFVESAGPPPPGSRVELHVSPPNDSVSGPVTGPVHVRGTIRWTRHAPAPASPTAGGFGVALDDRNDAWQQLCTRIAIA